ncbi:hypothetical protein CLV40_107115 [Actinokineospora auranticolor]|uniref:Uncharacterized protein n=1 Tax=Actinokineospora auranticolor TaxID=155976 RepID=A0A2S6GQQ3_9PSEU|nr:hypothetical protein CLV40_107115 [Actinokineospora auranticolor]
MTPRIERLVAHPGLPLVAGVDVDRPAVHVWDSTDLRHLDTIGADAARTATRAASTAPAACRNPSGTPKNPCSWC